MYVAKKRLRKKPRSILGLLGFGDPVTSPSDTSPPDDSVVVGEVTGARRVSCDDIPAGDPRKNDPAWCPQGDGTSFITDMIDKLVGALHPIETVAPDAPDTGMSTTTKLLLLAALGGGAYYWYQQSQSKKKGSRT